MAPQPSQVGEAIHRVESAVPGELMVRRLALSKFVQGGALVAILALYLGLSISTILTRRVVANEGWFADPAYHLLTAGSMRTTVLESKGTWLAGIDRHTYWILPLHPLAQVPWYKLFGFSLWSLRALSTAWGVVALAAWFLILLKLFDRPLATVATLLIAVDYHFTLDSALGRMDMMCAALGFAALAAFLWLRERSLARSLFVASSLVAAACLTHPCGILVLLALAALVLKLDRRKLRATDFTFAILPFALAAGCYGLYIAEAPGDFWRQMSGNISGIAGESEGLRRFSALVAPLSAIKDEVLFRYVSAFSAGGDWSSPFQFQIIVLMAYFGAVVSALIDRKLRRTPGVGTLLTLTLLTLGALCFLDGLKQKPYLVQTVPYLAALTAVWIWSWTEPHPRLRPWIIGVLVMAQVASTAYAVRENSYCGEYLSTANYLEAHARPGDLIIGGGELAFVLGYDANLIDDVRLGYLSGKQGRFYVQNRWYTEWLRTAAKTDPAAHQYIQDLLDGRYREVLRNPGYTVYELR
jgi:4-amino-4-deoxy-L-arabinose transferase-like glycosyltransferase